MQYMLNATQVAVTVGVTVPTINTWYKWKSLNPNNEIAQLLPDYYTLEHKGRSRYWKQEDVWKLIEFKTKIPHGKYGILGEVTQKYVKKEKTQNEKEVD